MRYGPNPRNRLDLFLPRGCAFFGETVVDAEGAALSEKASAASRPVIVFVTGGMWIIGYKAWGALLAMTLMRRGFIVASLDYRNFPQGTVGDMAADVGAGIGWVRRRAASRLYKRRDEALRWLERGTAAARLTAFAYSFLCASPSSTSCTSRRRSSSASKFCRARCWPSSSCFSTPRKTRRRCCAATLRLRACRTAAASNRSRIAHRG